MGTVSDDLSRFWNSELVKRSNNTGIEIESELVSPGTGMTDGSSSVVFIKLTLKVQNVTLTLHSEALDSSATNMVQLGEQQAIQRVLELLDPYYDVFASVNT